MHLQAVYCGNNTAYKSGEDEGKAVVTIKFVHVEERAMVGFVRTEKGEI